MNFEVYGPYVLERFGDLHGIVTKESRRKLKAILNEEKPGLASSRGCYVFAIRAATGYTPYYVGQAAKRPLFNEALSDHKLVIYSQVCSNTTGTPVLFFIPKVTATGKYSISSNKSLAVTFLERWLIAKALEKNSNLHNTSETRFLRKLHVVGVFNPTRGEANTDSSELKRALGL